MSDRWERVASAWTDALIGVLMRWGLLPQPVPVRVARLRPWHGRR
jgi:hypothetical protein